MPTPVPGRRSSSAHAKEPINRFQPVGHADATEKHPVCLQVIAAIGAGKVGGEIRKALRAAPYGWPQDAIDAALIALHRSQHITATLNGAPVPLGQLDQNKIAKAEFRVEHATLSVQDRLLVRKLITQLVQCKSGEEGAKAPEFLNAVVDLARAAGGNAPLPVQPATTDIEDMQRLVGNEQLVAIKDKAADLESRIKAWTTARDLAAKRLPSWEVVEHLARHAGDLPEIKPHLDQIEAIRTHRLLLEPTDSVAPIRVAIAGLLREAVNSAHTAHATAHEQAMATLGGERDLEEARLDATSRHPQCSRIGCASETRRVQRRGAWPASRCRDRCGSRSQSGTQFPDECSRPSSVPRNCWNPRCRRSRWSAARCVRSRRLMLGWGARNRSCLKA